MTIKRTIGAAGSDVKRLKIHNKSDKPDNVIEKENEIYMKCEAIERELPGFLRSYFVYLKGNVLPMSRLAYLQDVRFFFDYLISNTSLTDADVPKNIKLEEIRELTSMDVNLFIDFCRKYTVDDGDNGFDPIKVPKPGEREIKALQDDEVMIMLDAVSTGSNMTPHERKYWEKTKLRDKAILILFLTYGLRLSELQQLNISSFNFSRGEFIIYRKRGKESSMPINQSVQMTVQDYISNERSSIAEETEADEDALFLSLQGRRMTSRSIRDLVKKYTAIALNTTKHNGYSPHKLRATAATSLIGRGNSIYDVQALLDHEQVTTTQLYASHKMNVKRDLVKDMEWEIERKDND